MILFEPLSKRQKLAWWFEHVTRHDSLSKTILQTTWRRRGRQSWLLGWCLEPGGNAGWTSSKKKEKKKRKETGHPCMLTMASRRKDWKMISAESSVTLSNPPPLLLTTKSVNKELSELNWIDGTPENRTGSLTKNWVSNKSFCS